MNEMYDSVVGSVITSLKGFTKIEESSSTTPGRPFEETFKDLPFREELQRFFFTHHLYIVADVPHEYGYYAYDAALVVGEDPYELASLLISEHSGPDVDFSYEGSKEYSYTFSYSPTSEGKGGEIGLYQLKPRWAAKAGKFYGEDWKASDLYDPEINTRVAAFLLKHLKESHARKCGDQESSFHTWIAHYKCDQKSRDDLRGRCRWAQRKWDKVYLSLQDFGKANVKEIGKAHNERLRKLLEGQERKNKHALRVKIRSLCEEHDIEIPKNLKKKSLPELQNELQWLEESTGAMEGGE